MRNILAAFVAVAALVAPAGASADRGWRDGWNRAHSGSHGYHRGHRWHRWHHGPRFAVGYGAPFWWGPPVYGLGYGYGWGWGWGPPVVVRERVIEREPPVYVEREADPSDERAPEPEANAGTWYFCRSENAYYPDVEKCPEAWIPVPPRSE